MEIQTRYSVNAPFFQDPWVHQPSAKLSGLWMALRLEPNKVKRTDRFFQISLGCQRSTKRSPETGTRDPEGSSRVLAMAYAVFSWAVLHWTVPLPPFPHVSVP